MSRKGRIKAARNCRSKKDDNKFDKPESLTLSDVQCTVCVGIFIEPVTLPCHHSVCKTCFERTIDNNTLACPLCRKYVGGWVRQRQKNGLLVNQNLWSHISTRFRAHVEKKIRGEDDEVIDELNHTPSPRVSEPGSIRLEYEAEQKRIMLEVTARQQEEARASEKLIEELQQQEERERRKLEELRKKAEEEDALIAKQIAAQLAAEEAQRHSAGQDSYNSPFVEEKAPSAFVPLSPQAQASSSHQSQSKGPMDAFLNQSSVRVQRAGSSSSTDSFRNELHHFRPLVAAPKTPPKRSSGVKEDPVTLIRKPVPIMRGLDGWSPGGANTLRPWIQRAKFIEKQSSSDGSSVLSGSYDLSDAAISSSSGEKRPLENKLMKSPKKFRSRSLQEEDKSRSSCSTSLASESSSSTNQKSSSCKRSLVLVCESSNSDSEIDIEGYDDEHLSVRESPTCSELALTHTSEETSVGTVSTKCQNFDIHSALIPLSLEELSEQAKAEERLRQQQADYEFALKLQNELNAMESQNRSYELRSIVSLSPKKPQAKVTPPRSKVRQKASNSSSKKGRGRQCTLEETLNFSVKMEL